MASRSLKPTRQSMVKCKKQEGQADRETRAFVALQNRKISRKNDIEKKRGIPLMEISVSENEAQNSQERIKTEKVTKTTKRVDPLKEALKKWQKEKRLREIQRKKTMKEPFRPVTNVSRQLSEFSHTFQHDANQINTTKIKPKDITKTTRKANLLNSTREKKTGTTVEKPTTRPSNRTMKTRSMARKTTTAASTVSKSSTTLVPMAPDGISTSQQASCASDLPGHVTRSRVDENEASERTVRRSVRAVNLAPSFQPVPAVTAASIPNNVSFNVPIGVKSFVFCGDKFKLTPLSPNSAQRFFPSRTPVKELPNERLQTRVGESCNEEERLAREDAATVEMETVDEKGDTKDVLDAKYFRKLANSEIDRLKSRSALWEGEPEEILSEEVRGKIRTVIGQVVLLITKKFKQFNGLLDLSEDPTAEKKTLVSDLQGFWDMMYIQVEDIDKKFSELEEMKENNWEEKKVEIKKKNVKRTTKAKKKYPKTLNSKVSESRNKFREMRAQMKARLQTENNEEQDAFRIILTPMKNKKANADPCEPEIILTPVRRSTRKSRGCANIAIPVVNLTENVTIDLFGACSKTPEARIETNEYLSNLDDSMFLPCHTTPVPQISTADDLMIFSPTTPAQRG